MVVVLVIIDKLNKVSDFVQHVDYCNDPYKLIASKDK